MIMRRQHKLVLSQMIAMMAKKLKRENKNFIVKRHIPCFTHILNLVVQSAIKSFDIPYASCLIEEEGRRAIDGF